ncbi:MAG: hypothetical protein R3C44_20650 [Chloroflexota bacterium]
MSESVRRYMGATYHIPVLERTTAEIQADLRATAIDPAIRTQFVSFLQESDLVKFANFQPTTEDATALMGQARSILERSQAAIVVEQSNGQDGGDSGPLPPATPTFSANGQDQSEEVPA